MISATGSIMLPLTNMHHSFFHSLSTLKALFMRKLLERLLKRERHLKSEYSNLRIGSLLARKREVVKLCLLVRSLWKSKNSIETNSSWRRRYSV